MIASVDEVEDVKGNPGEKGCLIVTSLRVLWVMGRKPRINLSVGLGAVLNCELKKVSTRLGTSNTLMLNSSSGAVSGGPAGPVPTFLSLVLDVAFLCAPPGHRICKCIYRIYRI